MAELRAATRPGGLNLILTFTDHTPVPECHRLVDVFPDREQGLVADAYRDWNAKMVLDRAKPERAHADFPPHAHSFIKLLAKR